MPKQQPAPSPPPPGPPAHLSEGSQALWREIVPRRAASIERLELLRVALECRDRLEQIKTLLATEGLTKTTPATGAVHINPLLKMESETRRQLANLWTRLGLEWDARIDGRVNF